MAVATDMYNDEEVQRLLDLEKMIASLSDHEVDEFINSRLFKLFLDDLRKRKDLVIRELMNSSPSDIHNAMEEGKLKGELRAIEFCLEYETLLKRDMRAAREVVDQITNSTEEGQ